MYYDMLLNKVSMMKSFVNYGGSEKNRFERGKKREKKEFKLSLP